MSFRTAIPSIAAAICTAFAASAALAADWPTKPVRFIVPYTAGGGAVYPGLATQVMAQAKGVLVTLLWSGIGSTIVFLIIKLVFGLRVTEEKEREGLDITEHGERAYNH